MANRLVDAIEKAYLKKEIPQFEVGDTVDVATRIIEGDKERIQVFSGTVIARKGRGINEIFTVRRIVNNEGVERIYPVNSLFIASVTVRRSGESRRAKRFYLRKRSGEGGVDTPKRTEKRERGRAGAGGGWEGQEGVFETDSAGLADRLKGEYARRHGLSSRCPTPRTIDCSFHPIKHFARGEFISAHLRLVGKNHRSRYGSVGGCAGTTRGE